MDQKDVRTSVQQHYGAIAQSASRRSCCAPTACCGGEVETNSYTLELGYSEQEVASVPEGSDLGLGCGNPTAIAGLKQGEIVLDLGSGAGFDCFLAAQQVGPTGLVIGIDMTPEMVAKARRNAEKSHYTNVEFRLGEIEQLPVADSSVDVIISNCVINLSTEKQAVFKESYRVLRGGGRLAISDIVATATLPEKIRNDISLHCQCMGGAASIDELTLLLSQAGFVEIRIAPKESSRDLIREWAPRLPMDQFLISATIEAVKPNEFSFTTDGTRISNDK